jgi:hypothetical protein
MHKTLVTVQRRLIQHEYRLRPALLTSSQGLLGPVALERPPEPVSTESRVPCLQEEQPRLAVDQIPEIVVQHRLRDRTETRTGTQPQQASHAVKESKSRSLRKPITQPQKPSHAASASQSHSLSKLVTQPQKASHAAPESQSCSLRKLVLALPSVCKATDPLQQGH